MSSTRFFVFLSLLVLRVHGKLNLRCYSCADTLEEICKEEPKLASTVVCKGPPSKYRCVSGDLNYEGRELFFRDCSSKNCKSLLETRTITKCNECNTNYCNKGVSVPSSKLIVLILLMYSSISAL